MYQTEYFTNPTEDHSLMRQATIGHIPRAGQDSEGNKGASGISNLSLAFDLLFFYIKSY